MYSAARDFDSSRDLSLAARTLSRTANAAPHASLSSIPAPGGQPNVLAMEGLLQGQREVDGTAQRASACPVFPMNLSVTDRLLQHVEAQQSSGHASDRDPTRGPSIDLSSDALYRLQLDVNDYIEGLDSRLRGLVKNPNAALAKRMRQTSNVPLSFAYFRLQQKMLRLSGDLDAQREREMLNRLASALSA